MSFSVLGSAILVVAGLIFEVLGVFLMARRSFRIVRLYELPLLMISALFRAKAARGAAKVRELNSEDSLSDVQGLAFIGLGFFLQTAGFLLTTFR